MKIKEGADACGRFKTDLSQASAPERAGTLSVWGRQRPRCI